MRTSGDKARWAASGIACPCGTARCAFAEDAKGRASLHLVEVKQASERHYYHRRVTEIYYVLSGEGQIEFDGELRPVAAGDAVFIPPGVVHSVLPAFDPDDEWLVQ